MIGKACKHTIYQTSLRVPKHVKQIKFKGVLGRVRNKTLFPDTIMDKTFETRHYVKSSISIFQDFFPRTDKISIFGGRLSKHHVKIL